MFAFWFFLTNLISTTTICCIFSRTWKNFWQTIFILNDAENDWAYFVKKLATFHRILAHFDGSKLTAEFPRLQLGKKIELNSKSIKKYFTKFRIKNLCIKVMMNIFLRCVFNDADKFARIKQRTLTGGETVWLVSCWTGLDPNIQENLFFSMF